MSNQDMEMNDGCCPLLTHPRLLHMIDAESRPTTACLYSENIQQY